MTIELSLSEKNHNIIFTSLEHSIVPMTIELSLFEKNYDLLFTSLEHSIVPMTIQLSLFEKNHNIIFISLDSAQYRTNDNINSIGSAFIAIYLALTQRGPTGNVFFCHRSLQCETLTLIVKGIKTKTFFLFLREPFILNKMIL